jgi:hypothetical protein
MAGGEAAWKKKRNVEDAEEDAEEEERGTGGA